MAVFLKLHMDSVLAVGETDVEKDSGERFREALRQWREVQEAEGRRVTELVGYCAGVVGFLRTPGGERRR